VALLPLYAGTAPHRKTAIKLSDDQMVGEIFFFGLSNITLSIVAGGTLAFIGLRLFHTSFRDPVAHWPAIE
jgi:hypothetical protein